MIVQCCVCQKVRQGVRWVDPARPYTAGEAISHGYCPECAAAVFAMINQSSRAPRTHPENEVPVIDAADAPQFSTRHHSKKISAA